MTAAGNLDRARIASLKQREDAAFVAARPRSAELWARSNASMPNGVPMSWHRTSYDHPPLFVDEGAGARFRDVDGHEYSDFNIADMSMFAGYAPEPVVEAVSRCVARGTQFLLPNEDAPWVAEELGRRYGLPKWQFTLSATHANTEAIRIARTLTGRDTVLFFDGKYHGHFEEALVELDANGQLVPEEHAKPLGSLLPLEAFLFLIRSLLALVPLPALARLAHPIPLIEQTHRLSGLRIQGERRVHKVSAPPTLRRAPQISQFFRDPVPVRERRRVFDREHGLQHAGGLPGRDAASLHDRLRIHRFIPKEAISPLQIRRVHARLGRRGSGRLRQAACQMDQPSASPLVSQLSPAEHFIRPSIGLYESLHSSALHLHRTTAALACRSPFSI